MGGAFLFGSKIGRNPDKYLKSHLTKIKILLLAYIVFTGCFVFPIRSEQFALFLAVKHPSKGSLKNNSLIDFLVCRDRGDVMLPSDFLIGSWWHIGRCFLLGDRTYQCLCGFFTSERTVSVLFNLCIYLIYISTTGYSI